MVWDELDRSEVKEGNKCSAYVGTPSRKAFQVKLVERMPRVCKAVIKAKGDYFEESKIYFDFLKHDSICVISELHYYSTM
jgi:hypothetical protein